MVKKFPRILVCPLDWGIGHATRCVPVIRELQANNAEVVIGADGRAMEFLQDYFPETEKIKLPGFNIRYPSGGSMALSMMSQAPKILSGIRKEHHLLEKIIKTHQIQAVISDNRFGMWSESAYSVYITHQLRIKGPTGLNFMEPVLSSAHKHFWKKYDEIWIPDLAGRQNLSGDLGHPGHLPQKCQYIGPLSRFSGFPTGTVDRREDAINVLVLLSGPEPQRSIFEKTILDEAAKSPSLNTVILQGLPGESVTSSPFPNVVMYSHLPDEEIASLVRSAGTIVSRPGYSTLMDLACLGKTAVLVPTPGQTEQEYLAEFHSGRNFFGRMAQAGFSFEKAIKISDRKVFPMNYPSEADLLGERVRSLVGKLSQ